MTAPFRFHSKLLVAAVLCSLSGAPSQAADRMDHGADPGAAAHRTAMSAIRDKAASMPLDERKDIDKRIAATVERVNRDVTATGPTKVASKIASRLGMTVDDLLAVKSERGFSWGELVVAQTLLSDSERPITLEDLGSLRAEGFSWGALAYALGFHLDDLEDEIKTQGKIAAGLTKGTSETK